MHRRLFTAVSLVVVLSLATPVFAAPRRDSNQNFFDQIVLKLKKIFHPSPLDLTDPMPPKP